MFGPAQKRAKPGAGARAGKLHSIAAIMRERSFAGRFDVAGVSYRFFLSPEKAALAGGKLQLSGSFSVVNRRPNVRLFRRDLPVRAT
ncbi:MAG TPA: hypothetical protein VI837_01540, partial [Blastocatellia bacterium]|nr:hypothetical protein [Blastocatellia bacterium]